MTASRTSWVPALALAAVVACGASPVLGQAVDAASAEALLQKNKCTKCHSVDKKKDGPSYKETAGKYRGKADGEARVTTHITSGPRIKIDGVEEEHAVLKASEPESRNVALYILSR